MRKSNALLFVMMFVTATVCCPSNAASQAGTSANTEERDNAALEAREQRAIATMSPHWTKARCIRSVNNFATSPMAGSNIRAKDLYLILQGLSTCDTYAWTYEQRNQLSFPLPFKVMADKEQEFLAGFLNARIQNYIRRQNLDSKFASELVYHNYNSVAHNTVLLSDSLDFLHRHGLMEAFAKDDDLQFQKLDPSERIEAIHATALRFGLTQ
jgi:hypothetical protein